MRGQIEILGYLCYLQCFSIPDLHCLVKRTGYKHASIIWIPLDCLNTEFVHMPTGSKWKSQNHKLVAIKIERYKDMRSFFSNQ